MQHCVLVVDCVVAGAQLGIIFDTDVDRSAVVDGDGTPINSNRFIALMAAIVLQVRRGTWAHRLRLWVEGGKAGAGKEEAPATHSIALFTST